MGHARTAIAVLFAATVMGCSSEEPAPSVARPASVDAMVLATANTPGLAIEMRVGNDGDVILHAMTTLDVASGRAYQTAEGITMSEITSSDLPPLTDLGDSWVIDNEGYTREPGSSTARPTPSDLSDLLFAEGANGRGDDLAGLLSAWLADPAPVSISDSVTVDGIPTHHLRFNRPNDDVLDVWVDAAGRVVQAARPSKTPVPIQLRLRFDYLGDAPEIPALPEVVDPQASG